MLSDILRIVVGLNTTKNQLAKEVRCQISKKEIRVIPIGSSTLDIEIWAADRNKTVLEKHWIRQLVSKPRSSSIAAK